MSQIHEKKTSKPWDVDLKIGCHISIPVTALIRIENIGNTNKKTSQPSQTKTKRRDKAFYDEYKAEVDPSDVYVGYKFGGTIVPSFENDKYELYQPGYQSLSLYGFTLAHNIQWQHLKGKGLSYLFGRKGNKKAKQAITCLTEILHEKKLVGIVRKVHNNNNAPKMFVLMPVIHTNYNMCLSMICLCYKEEIKYMKFPPTNIRKYMCTKDQVNTFKDLIRAMDLNNAYDHIFDGTEQFPIDETVGISAQYLLNCIAYHALNADQPQSQARDDSINPIQSCQEAQQRVKNIFLLQKLQPKHRKRAMRLVVFDTPDQPLPDIKSEDDAPYDNINTIDPVKDFSVLLNNGKSLTDLAIKMSDVIETLWYFNLDGTYTKAIDAMTCFRNECVKIDPSAYNDWLLKFKVDLTNRNRYDIQHLIKEKGLDYILKAENNLSTFETIDSHEQSQLYDMDTVPESTEIVIKPEVNDMFDEM